jgi:2,4-dienoyl-CoA reductase (NADPH2)
MNENIICSTAQQKNILIIGAGPSGMEAARLLGEQGHKVQIWDRDKDIGGTVRVAALAYEPNGHLIDYLKNALDNLGISISLNTEATLDNINTMAPDQVIIATGAKRTAPEIKGSHLSNVFDGEEMRGLLFGTDKQAAKKLSGFSQVMLVLGRWSQILRSISTLRALSKLWMPIKDQVTIIGGDLVGLELAEFLIERGRKICILEPSQTLGVNLSIVRRSRVIHLLKEHGCELVTNANVEQITKAGVHYKTEDIDHFHHSKQVIIALGATSDRTLYDQVQTTDIPVVQIGDCRDVGYIHGAMADARDAILKL